MLLLLPKCFCVVFALEGTICTMYMHSLELHVYNAMPVHVCKLDIVCAPVIQRQGLVFMS